MKIKTLEDVKRMEQAQRDSHNRPLGLMNALRKLESIPSMAQSKRLARVERMHKRMYKRRDEREQEVKAYMLGKRHLRRYVCNVSFTGDGPSNMSNHDFGDELQRKFPVSVSDPESACCYFYVNEDIADKVEAYIKKRGGDMGRSHDDECTEFPRFTVARRLKKK